jgi:hypothetical protein
MKTFRQYLIEARYTNQQLNKWVNSKYWDDRQAAAKYGNDSHKDILVDDPHERVRIMVAKYGNFKHKKALWNDPDEYVRKAARGNFIE